MVQINLPEPITPDIFSFNFDKRLYRSTPIEESSLVYNQFNQTNPSLLSTGTMRGEFSLVSGNIKSGNFITGSAGWQILATGDVEFNSGTFRGALIANSLDIPDTTTANSFHVNTNGDVWWGSTTIGSAVAKVLKTGVATFTSIILSTSVKINDIVTGSEIAIQGWTHDMVFSASDADTVAWGSGTITLLNGDTYSIDAGNTGNMAAETFIYLDIGTSTTVLQTSTTKTNAIGTGKIMIAISENATDEAEFIVFGSPEANIDGAKIRANSITANEITANTITASEITGTTLSAIYADLGTITAGDITLDTAGFIKGGQTDYNTGVGFFLGYSGAYKFSLGDPAGNHMTWDGTTLTINGDISASTLYAKGIVTPTSTGTTALTTGFTPKLITIRAVGKRNTGGGGSSFGSATTTSDETSIFISSTAKPNSSTSRVAILYTDDGTTLFFDCEISAIDSTSFTINVTTYSSVGSVIYLWEAFG